jgi:hypothetical protein
VLDGAGGRQVADVLMRDGKIVGFGRTCHAPPVSR